MFVWLRNANAVKLGVELRNARTSFLLIRMYDSWRCMWMQCENDDMLLQLNKSAIQDRTAYGALAVSPPRGSVIPCEPVLNCWVCSDLTSLALCFGRRADGQNLNYVHGECKIERLESNITRASLGGWKAQLAQQI